MLWSISSFEIMWYLITYILILYCYGTFGNAVNPLEDKAKLKFLFQQCQSYFIILFENKNLYSTNNQLYIYIILYIYVHTYIYIYIHIFDAIREVETDNSQAEKMLVAVKERKSFFFHSNNFVNSPFEGSRKLALFRS